MYKGLPGSVLGQALQSLMGPLQAQQVQNVMTSLQGLTAVNLGRGPEGSGLPSQAVLTATSADQLGAAGRLPIPTRQGGNTPGATVPGVVGFGSSASGTGCRFASAARWFWPSDCSSSSKVGQELKCGALQVCFREVPPVPKVEQWKTREQEVLGFSEYVSQLSQWASQASLSFGQEIEAAVRCPHELNFAAMDVYQQARSSRLLAILKSSFLQHGRISLMISAYLESEHYSTVGMPNRCGFELLRRLELEYSLRSRSEAVALRTSLVSRSYLATSAESSQATLVADSVRKLELELSRCNRLCLQVFPVVLV